MATTPLTGDTQYILNGIGTTILKRPDKLLRIENSQDLSITMSATTGTQVGGDGYFPLSIFTTGKSGKVDITDAMMSINQVQFSQGGTIQNHSRASFMEYVTPASGTAQLSATQDILIDTVTCQDMTTGLVLEQVTGTPTAGQYSITAAGVMTFPADFTSQVFVVGYVQATSGGVSLEVLNNSLTEPFEVMHQLHTEEQDDGNRYQIDVWIRKAKCDGAWTYEAKRGSAYSPKTTFEVMGTNKPGVPVMIVSAKIWTPTAAEVQAFSAAQQALQGAGSSSTND